MLPFLEGLTVISVAALCFYYYTMNIPQLTGGWEARGYLTRKGR